MARKPNYTPATTTEPAMPPPPPPPLPPAIALAHDPAARYRVIQTSPAALEGLLNAAEGWELMSLCSSWIGSNTGGLVVVLRRVG